jgi:hypothetical protein
MTTIIERKVSITITKGNKMELDEATKARLEAYVDYLIALEKAKAVKA